jgi:uncharacterized protein YlxW (UPF0749 family)
MSPPSAVMSSTPEHEQPPPRGGWRGFGGVRAQLLVAFLLAVLGFAAVTQVRLTRTDDDFSGQRREDLVDLLDSLSAAADRTRGQLADLEQTRDELMSSSERRQAAIDEGNERLQVLQILTGTVAAEGPGVTITVDDPEDAVPASTLLNGVEELRDAGAEAVEINDVVRVVASTYFTESDGVVSVDGVELRAPYVIDAIGSSHTLSDAVSFPGGFADGVEQYGGSVDVREKDLVEVGSLHTLETPEYSQPTSG